MSTLNKKDAKALFELNELFSQANTFFACMSLEGQNNCLAAHKEGFSLNHAVRWGLQATEDLMDAAKLLHRMTRAFEVADMNDDLILEKLRDIFEKSDHIFSEMSNETKDKFLEVHEGNYSLNHAVRSGLKASNELVAGVHRRFIRELLKSDPYPREIPKGELLNNGWHKADEYTKDIAPGAAFMRTIGGSGTPFASYDLTIIESDSGKWVPMHGSVKMPLVESPEKAAHDLMQYWHDADKFRFDVDNEMKDYFAFAKEKIVMNEGKAIVEMDWNQKMEALDVLRAFPGKSFVFDLYDNDKEFSDAINDVFGESFEYPDFSHRTVAQVVKMGEKEIAKSLPPAQKLTFSEFSTFATAVKLENHGRQWEVFYGEDNMGFADGPSVSAALKMAHVGAVNNAIYANSPEAPEFMQGTQVFPPENVVAEYPHLKVRFADVFAARGDVAVDVPKNVGKYAHGEWSHLFGDGKNGAKETHCRIVIDLEKAVVVAAQEWTGLKFEDIHGDRVKSLAESAVEVNEAHLDFDLWNPVFSNNLPEWGIQQIADKENPVAPRLMPAFEVGQRFELLEGYSVVANGYRGTVAKVLDGQFAGTLEVRLPGGVTFVSASFPDCFPAFNNEVEVVTDGKFFGSVKEVSGQFVVQDAGRGRLVAHECHRFDKLPAVGDSIDLQHRGGKVTFLVEKDKVRGVGR